MKNIFSPNYSDISIYRNNRIPFKARIHLDGTFQHGISYELNKKLLNSKYNTRFIIYSMNICELEIYTDIIKYSRILLDNKNSVFINRMMLKYKNLKINYKSLWIKIFVYDLNVYLKNKNILNELKELQEFTGFPFLEIYNEYKKLH